MQNNIVFAFQKMFTDQNQGKFEKKKKCKHVGYIDIIIFLGL